MAALAVLAGCDASMPSGFWREYQHDTVAEHVSEQHPWGGERWMLWNSPVAAFVEADVQRFAVARGWTFLERVEVPGQTIVASTLFGADDRARRRFATAIPDESVLLKFDSGWKLRAGSSESGIAYGYVQISKDGRRMAVYHAWGSS